MTKVLTLKIQLVEPLLATGLEGDPNAATGLVYIPGSVVRGAAIGKYRGKKDSADPNFRRLFLDGTTRFLNGYVSPDRETRFLPCPLSLVRDKYRLVGSEIVEDHAMLECEPDATKQWQSVQPSSPFVRLDSSNSEFMSPERTIHIHTQRNKRLGHAVQGEGAVFRYESLAARQDFLAHVIVQNDDVQLLCDLLNGAFCLGGSRTAGYGHCNIQVADSVPELNAWSEYGGLTIENVGSSDAATVRLTLLSDWLLRDQCYGAYSVAASSIRERLGQMLGISIASDQCQMYLRSTVVGGFNRRWGLPLPQAKAVAMGSVIVLHDVSVSKSEMQRLLISGIGERIAEGFGRIAIDWNAGKSFKLKKHEAIQSYIATRPQHTSLALQDIQQRIRIDRIEARILQEAQTLAQKRPPADSRSRLQSLKLKAMDELRNNRRWNDGAGLRDHIAKLESRRTVRDKFAKIKTSTGIQILKWMGELLERPTPTALQIPDLQSGKEESYRLTDLELYQYWLNVVIKMLGLMAKNSKTIEQQGVEA